MIWDNLLDNTPNQASRNGNNVINDGARGTYNTNSQIKFTTLTLKSSLCDYSDAYILVKGAITIAPAPAPASKAENNNKEVAFKYCAAFTDSISEINIMQIDNAKGMDVVMSMYNLIEYSNNKSSRKFMAIL